MKLATKNKLSSNYILWTLLAIVLGLVLSFSFLPIFEINPVEALETMISELFSNSYSMGNILVKTTPLILTALAFAFTYKANLFNIGVQGQFYLGCITSAAISIKLHGSIPSPLIIIFALVGSAISGGLLGFLIGFFKAKFGANEFLVSMMSNYVIIYLNMWLMRTVLQESRGNYIKTDYLDESVWLPRLIPGTSVSWGILLAVLIAISVWFILFKTSLGFRIRVTGMNSEAGAMASIDPGRQYMIAFAISGAIAGFAGFIEVNGMQHMMLPDFNVNIGSYGLGIAILANSNPLGVIPAALLFGFLQAGGQVLGRVSDAPPSVVDLMQGFVMLLVLMSFYFRKKIETKQLKSIKLDKEVEV